MKRERALKVVLVLVGVLFSAGVYPLIGGLLHPADSDTGDTMMMSLYFALGIFLLIAVRKSISASQPDRLRGMVMLCPCCDNFDPRTRNREPACRISDRIGCTRHHRRSPDRAGSGEVSRASYRCSDVGLAGYGRFGGKAAVNEFTVLRWITIQTGVRHYPF